jgi:hypothetical protein
MKVFEFYADRGIELCGNYFQNGNSSSGGVPFYTGSLDV